jgi:hypothetical protein
MPIQAILYDGTRLEFPDGTDQEVIDRVAREETEKRRPVAFEQPAPSRPPTERTWGEAAKDVAASAITGAGSLVAAPGQLISLVPGLTGVGQALATPGEMISKAGEDLKSIGLKTREALRSEALSEAEKDGIIAQFATAIKSTITDPALLTSFLSEQVPLLLGPAVAVKVTQLLGRGAIAAAGRGLTGVAAKEAQDVAAQQVAKTATRAAIGTGAAMQAADISSDAYQTAYQKALLQGKPEDQAQEEALNAARIAGAGAGAASLATAGLLGRIGGTAIERKLAGIPGAGRPISMFGEATSEGLEESAGQIFKNIGVRQVDPTQSLTEGVGAAAGLGVLGGAFFGGLLGGRTEPPLAPGQRPGETLTQTANRLNAEIALLNQQISPPSPERPFLDDKELFALAAQPNGSLKLIEYSEQLRQMPQSDERDKAIKDALTLYTQKVIEEKARKTPEDKEYPHAQELPETKAPIPYPSFNQLVTMVSKIGDAKQAVQELDQYAASIKNLPDSPEKTDHLKSVAELKKIVQTEAAARQPKGGPEPFVIKSFDLNQQGITRSDPLHHQIVGKNISNAEDYEYVLRQLEKALDRPKLSPAKYAAIEGLIDALEANLERIEGSGFYARPTVYEPIGAGAGVVSGDVGQPATKRPAKPKRPRVAGTQEYLGAPVSGEAAEPTALEGFPPYVEGPEPGLELEEFPPPGAEEAAKELRRMEREVRRLTYRPTPNLFNVLSGRLDRQEVLDIGSSKGQVEVPYRGLIAKNQRGVIIGDLVGEGTLDQFLPFDMRSDHPKFDAIDAAEFIKEKLRNRDHLTEEASQALARLNLSISDIAEQVTAYELEKLLREANAQLQTEFEEQRKRDQEGEISATEIAYRDLEGGAGEAAFTTERPLVKKDPFTIDVEARVISDVIERNVAALDPRKIEKLEAAYGMSSGTAEAFSDKFLKRIQKDLEILDTQGRLAIESSIRGTIGPLLAKVKPEVKRLAKEPLTIDVEARVIETTIGRQVKALPSPDVVKLENHYGVKAGSKEFLQKVKEDVVLFATKGAKAVASAIRSVIKAIHSGVLSVALVFNPININPPEAYAIVPKAPPVEAAKTTEAKAIELAQVPESVQGMSDAAKQAYQTLIPSLDGKIGDKLIVIADKPSGRMFVFTSDGKLVTQNKALYGAAKGDLYKGNVDVPANRVTPAGLFGLKLVDAAKGGAAKVTAGEYEFGKVFALEDPEAVITIMHSVWLKEADAPRRQAALANQDPEDSRYSFGCINVDKDTYKFLLDNYQAQMDGAKLFVVPDNQAQVKEFLSGQIAQNLGGKKPGEGPDRLVREAVVKKSLRDVTKGVPEAKFKELEQRAKKPREEQKEVAAPKADEAPEVTALKAQKALKVSQLQNVLKKILGQYGLQNVDLNLEEGMQNEGSYSGLLIKLALDNVDPVRVLRHESVHALKELGFFTPQQWKVLTDRANKEWIDTFLKNRNIDGLPLEPGQQSRYDAYMKEYKGDEEAVMEEAIADAFAYFRGTKAPAGMMSAILNRMSNLFKAIQRAMNLGGYNTAEDVFGAIEKGKLKPTAPVSQAKAKVDLGNVESGTAEAIDKTFQLESTEARFSLRSPTTPEFKRWFGDSKVVDENGDPLVVYHGSPVRDFTVFDIDKANPNDPDGPYNGFFFSSSFEEADSAGRFPYGRPNAPQAQTRAFYLSVKNPATRKQARIVAKELEDTWRNDPTVRTLQEATRKELQRRGFDGIIHEPYVIPSKAEFEKNGRVALGKRQGELVLNKDGGVDLYEGGMNITGWESFDAAVNDLKHGTFIAFDPTQIKSATDNVGTFDVTSPDIRYSLRTKTPEFKFWFGQSKIVDDEGQPKVMYHGTGKEYEILGTARRQAKAIFVTDDPKFAEQFAKDTFAKAAVEAAQGVGISPESYKRGVDRAIAAVRKDYGNRPEGKEMIAGIRLGYNDANAEAQEYMRNAFKGELPAGPNIIPVYVKADNPFDYENADHVKQIKSLTATLSGVLEDSPIHLTMMNNIAKGNWEVIEKISVQEAIRTLGFDGFYVKEQGRKSLAVYEPNQLKSVFNDKPTTRPELRLSLRTMPTLAQDVTNRVSQTIAPRIRPGYLERIQDALTPKGFSWFRKEFVNKYEAEARNDRAVAEQIRLMGGTEQLADVKSESAALASDLGGGLAAAAFGVHDRRGGYPVYKKRYLVEKDFLQLGTYQTRAAAEQAARRVGAEVFEIGHTVISNEGDVEGLIAIYSPLMKYKKPAPGEPDVFSLYQFWADVKRASRYIYNPGTGKYTEKLFNDPNDIKRAKEIEQQYPEFKDIHAKWIKYNDKLVDFMRDTGVISAQGAIEMKAHGDYFPFYRHLGENDVQGPKLFSSISGVRAPKAAKGSEAEVTDFFETVVRNTQSAIQAGIKNIAARRATDQALRLNSVQRVQGVATGPAAYRVLEDGKEVYYEADDLMFVESLKSLNQTDIPGLNFVAFPAQLLRALVTKDPAFMLANMMRDSVSAWQTSGVKITPIVSTLKQFANALSGTSPELQALLNAGVVGGYDYSRGVEKSAKELEAEMRKQAKALTTLEKITSLPRSLWGALEKGSAASDAATRMEIYKKVLAETNNEAEALWQSLEVMNFNRKGRSPIIRILTAAVPFLNARIQGLDVLYRSGIRPGLAADSTEAEQQRFRTFWKRGVMMMGLAGAYWALTHDDDEYKKQEQETRDNYWLIPSLGIKIPIAFEVGFMFKVVPERILQLFFGSDTGEEFLKSMGRQLHSTFGVGLPQIINPAVEVAANFSFFTQRNIVGQGLEGVAPKYQVGPNTSSLSAIIGQSLNISPTKLDHLFQGYFGTLGMYAVSLVDSAIEMTSDAPKPAKRLEQMPVIKRFLVDPEARGSVTAYYDMKNSVDEVVRTSNYLMRSGDFASYSEYMRDNIRMLAIKDYINDLEKTMKEFREMKNTIRISSSDAETKRDALISIGKLEQNVTKNIQYLKSLLK